MQPKSQPETSGVERAVYLYDQMPHGKACEPMTVFGENNLLTTLVQDMIYTMRCNNGVGIAAPQVGVLYQVCVVRTETEELVLINPQVTHSSGKQVNVEGCLSLPGFQIKVPRAQEVTVHARLWKDGIVGEEVDIHAEGYEATVFQHEIDHLRGEFFVDRLSRLKYGIVCRKFQQMRGGRRRAR